MKVNYRSAGGAAISHDGEHHRIALASVPPGDQNPMAPGLEHVAFKLRSVAELLGNYKRLRAIDINPFMAIHHGGTLSAYYLGVPVDFDAILDRYEGGESLASLLEQPMLQDGQLDELIGKIMEARSVKA